MLVPRFLRQAERSAQYFDDAGCESFPAAFKDHLTGTPDGTTVVSAGFESWYADGELITMLLR
jgi:hypothetical protein